MASPEAFTYLYQHFCGITAASLFFGIEGRRRNFPLATIASFVVLSAFGSLPFSLNLFFVLILFTPSAQHQVDVPRHDALFTPHWLITAVPVVIAILLEQNLPYALSRRADLTLLRAAYFTIPLFLALTPLIVPKPLGHLHTTKVSAHRAYIKSFYALSVTSALLYLKQTVTTVAVNTPPPPPWAWDLYTNYVSKSESPNRFLAGLSETGQKLKLVSVHPATSVTSYDVLLTALGLLVWTFLRKLDVQDVLENSFLSFMAPSTAEKHVVIKDTTEIDGESADEHPAVTPKKRGRPKKNAHSSPPSVTSTGSVRRSTRRRTANPYFESDGEEAYEPSVQTSEAVQQLESDGAHEDDVVAAGESTALSLFFFFLGGLGSLAAGVLGAEATGGA